MPTAGDLLVATPRLTDPNFERAVVYVIVHGRAGTLGVVINRESDTPCADAVPRWATRFAEGAVVGLGGPVEPQGLLALGATLASPDATQTSPRDANDATSDTSEASEAGTSDASGASDAGTSDAGEASDAGTSAEGKASDAMMSDAGGVWRNVKGGVGLVDLTADPDDLDAAIAIVRLFGGHAGWGPGQLRSELEAGCWWVLESTPDDLAPDPETLWHDVLARQSSPARLLAHFPDDRALN